MPKKCDAVFAGGGVKGIGLAGAVAVTEQLGYEFCNVAGTSAGAIVAALIAAGYTSAELTAIMRSLDYAAFKDEGWLDRVPLVGKALSLGLENGIYEGAYIEQWIRERLAAKGKRTFRDLVLPAFEHNPQYRYRLQVIASDISRGRLLVLPRDIASYGLEPDELDIARAVRMSMSIPFFFEPVTLDDARTGETSYIVDGGILSNFPIQLFDDGTPDPPWPTFGYMFAENPDVVGARVSHEIHGPLSLFAAIVSTMMEAHDRMYITNSAFVRTIMVPTAGVQATDLDLKPERAQALYQTGVAAARDFFTTWDFEKYKKNYREAAAKRRRDVV